MFLLRRIPRLLKWLFTVLVFFLVLMMLYRIFFFWHYKTVDKVFSMGAFVLGLRYDLRVVGIMGMIILILSVIPGLHPFKRLKSSRFWNFLLTFFLKITLLIFIIDFYHYDYLHQRLNASVLNYFSDAGISAKMVWQTYPLIKVILLLALLAVAAWIFFRWLLSRYQQVHVVDKRRKIWMYVLSSVLLGVAVFGKVGQYPLRWSDAFSLEDDFKSNVALNPFQSFFSTLSFRNSTFDIEKVKSNYTLMAGYLGVKELDSVHLNYNRNYTFTDTAAQKPNIVLVICESFSAYKSSAYGNPLNTTPYFDALTKQGLFFDRCFTPAYGTARGVWATITGIPDVESPRTASRNPSAVDQQTIINNFVGYDKFYFLGGSANWANIRGLLTNNIHALHLYEQDDYHASKVDVWGISDKNLFLEANKALAKQQHPFFAIIQTADNHRPYTIPDEDQQEFKKLEVPIDSLKKYGFESNAEFNAFRYTDFCYQKFMEAAQKEPYFGNTIFVFVGDHGIRGNAGNMFPKSWTTNGLTCEHVPLLFYGPKWLQAGRISRICSQVDILPTLASLAKIPYQNNTFGKNLMDTGFNNINSDFAKEKFAFIIDHDEKTIGLLNNKYYYFFNMKSKKENFVSVEHNDPVIETDSLRALKAYMNQLTQAYYETAKYLLLNNKKK